MARISFTLKSNVGSAASTTGSFLQAASVNYGADNPSALKADGYVTTPTSVPGSLSFLSASPTDYDKVYLSWGITTALATEVVSTPAITTLELRYSLIGPPQTLAEGIEFAQPITADNSSSSFTHVDLPSGKWIYYTLFAKYESTDTRSWYERVVSTEVLVPQDYGYSNNLFRRIPLHYRIQDEQIGLTNLLIPKNDPNYDKIASLPESLKIAGPLQRMLDVFGWEINVIKTIIDYVMKQKDPFVANSEMIEKLAVEVGLPLSVVDLGTAKLRELIANFTYLTQNEGLLTGVEEYITAITGCHTEINNAQPDLLTSTHHAMTSASVTTSASVAPATNQWLLESSAHTMTAASAYTYSDMFTTPKALAITHSSGASVQMACLKAKVQNVSQASRLYMDFGATYNGSGASVIGCWLGASVLPAASVSYAPVTGASTSLINFITTTTNSSTSVFEWPVDFGVCGDGSLSTTDMYLHIWIASQSSNTGSLYLIPNRVTTLNRYPYYIDVYSRRLNLVRDPQFTITPSTALQATSASAYWRVATTSGSVSSVIANKVFTATPSTSASVTLSTDVNNGGTMQYTPISTDTDYFLSIDDYNDNIVQVSVKNLDGSITIASATTPYIQDTISGIAKRKYWKLEFVDNYPWYPRNSYLYHLEITATATATSPLKVSRPLFEPSAPNAYFDGNSDNGGWLGGSETPGAADYRWGQSTAHTKFSYYTADYRRVVEATKRMIEYMVPVTETTYALANLRFNRIPGYTGATVL
jgi:hypothetical protein